MAEPEPVQKALERYRWLDEAHRLLESGAWLADVDDRLHARIIETLDRKFGIGLPWCGLFVGHCLRRANPDVEFPQPSARAKPWLEFGEPCAPQFGALMIFFVGSPESPLGHVGFYWGEDEGAYHILSGNQYDDICVARYYKDHLLDARWPSFGPRPMNLTVRRAQDEALPNEWSPETEKWIARLSSMLRPGDSAGRRSASG